MLCKHASDEDADLAARDCGGLRPGGEAVAGGGAEVDGHGAGERQRHCVESDLGIIGWRDDAGGERGGNSGDCDGVCGAGGGVGES